MPISNPFRQARSQSSFSFTRIGLSVSSSLSIVLLRQTTTDRMRALRTGKAACGGRRYGVEYSVASGRSPFVHDFSGRPRPINSIFTGWSRSFFAQVATFRTLFLALLWTEIMGRCVFAGKWLSDPRFESWLQAYPSSNGKARCKCCRKNIDIASMGEAALVSHMKGKRHVDLSSSQRSTIALTNFLPPASSSTTPTETEDRPVQNPSTPSTLASGPPPKDVLTAEILWTLNLVTKHHSFKSSEI